MAVLDFGRSLGKTFPRGGTTTSTGVNPLLASGTRLMDEAVRIPGTSFRVGLDGLLGLVPGLGDAVTLLMAAFMLGEARRLGVPKHQQARIAAYYGLDFLLGLVPVLGDLFDFAFKANRRSLDLLHRHAARGRPHADFRT
jgi:hypothetical protein